MTIWDCRTHVRMTSMTSSVERTDLDFSPGLHCLSFHLHLLDASLYDKTMFKFEDNYYIHFFGYLNFFHLFKVIAHRPISKQFCVQGVE